MKGRIRKYSEFQCKKDAFKKSIQNLLMFTLDFTEENKYYFHLEGKARTLKGLTKFPDKQLFNRLGVAGAVLQTPPPIIN